MSDSTMSDSTTSDSISPASIEDSASSSISLFSCGPLNKLRHTKTPLNTPEAEVDQATGIALPTGTNMDRNQIDSGSNSGNRPPSEESSWSFSIHTASSSSSSVGLPSLPLVAENLSEGPLSVSIPMVEILLAWRNELKVMREEQNRLSEKMLQLEKSINKFIPKHLQNLDRFQLTPDALISL